MTENKWNGHDACYKYQIFEYVSTVLDYGLSKEMKCMR